jgi:transcriptional regulator with XRE-family HTH domain
MPRGVNQEALHGVSTHIGKRMRERRVLLGLSQSSLGDRLGLSFQQIQKYEKGTNSLSADRLLQVAGVLGVELTYFFDGLETEASPASAERPPELSRSELRMIGHLRALPPVVRDAITNIVSSAVRGVDDVAEDGEAAADESDDASSLARKRRRRGAVWDPADIKA